jgi:Autotransporter beta-domain
MMTKKIFYLSIIFVTSFFSSLSFAASNGNTYGLGVEGFHDNYREPSVSLDNNAIYGSLTGYYSREMKNAFVAVDGRVSYGSNDYESTSGTSEDEPQWEFELRTRGGYSFPLWGGAMSPYTGLGLRYFRDESKGTVTSLGFSGYDRRITQLYLPVGLSYAYTTSGGWTITPQAEFDWLLYGNVNSRLQNVSSAYYNIENDQHEGYGFRGEIMVGKVSNGYSWQAGPFFRYWNVADSKITTAPDNSQWLEPENDRTQIGVAVRVLW